MMVFIRIQQPHSRLLTEMFMNQFVVGTSVFSHQLHHFPVFGSSIGIQVEPSIRMRNSFAYLLGIAFSKVLVMCCQIVSGSTTSRVGYKSHKTIAFFEG